MTLKKLKWKKSRLEVPNELYVIETLTKLRYCSEEVTMCLLVYCNIMLL